MPLKQIFIGIDRIKALIKREEEKSKQAETKAGQMLSTKEPEGYAECYPGMSEMADAIDDSDDEADYSKMDLVRKIKIFSYSPLERGYYSKNS
jgi:RED-like protein C-terminal region